MKLAAAAPEQAMHLLQNLDHLEASKMVSGQAQVLAKWAGNDPGAAGKWLLGQNENAEYDTLAGSYARAIAKVDSATAIKWAKSIGDESIRKRAEQGVVASIIRGGTEKETLVAAGYTMNFIEEAIKKPSGQAYGFADGSGNLVSFMGNDMTTEVLNIDGDRRMVFRGLANKEAADLVFTDAITLKSDAIQNYQLRMQDETGANRGIVIQANGNSVVPQVTFNTRRPATEGAGGGGK
jgi:hypothetical protein